MSARSARRLKNADSISLTLAIKEEEEEEEEEETTSLPFFLASDRACRASSRGLGLRDDKDDECVVVVVDDDDVDDAIDDEFTSLT